MDTLLYKDNIYKYLKVAPESSEDHRIYYGFLGTGSRHGTRKCK